MDIILKMQKIMLAENSMQSYNFYMTVICNETVTQKV